MFMYFFNFYQKFGEETIHNWCKSLQYFRLCRSHPYPDDLVPDRFVVKISFTTNDELDSILENLEISLRLPNSELEPFKEYNENHSSGWVLINNSFCNLDVNKILKMVTIDVSGTIEDLFELKVETFQRAIEIEKQFKKYNFKFIDPPEDDAKYCLAPKFYPEIWG